MNHVIIPAALAAGVLASRLEQMYGKQVLDNVLTRWNVKARLVRWMQLPILWRVAVRLADTQPHNDTGICLACHAKGRRAVEEHQPKDSPANIIVCGKCGAPMSQWGKRCKGVPKFVRQPQRQPRTTSKPVFWE
jgi:hypothetical protein